MNTVIYQKLHTLLLGTTSALILIDTDAFVGAIIVHTRVYQIPRNSMRCNLVLNIFCTFPLPFPAV